jgi:hypothetical protein
LRHHDFSYYDNYTGGGGEDVGTDIQLNRFRLTKDSEGLYYFEDNDGTTPYDANDLERADKKKYILTEVRDTEVVTPFWISIGLHYLWNN